jgi:CRP-like cAMP-binding protein
MLDAVPLFASLTEEEKEALASTMTRRTYRRNDIVAEQGAKLSALMVIRSGVVVVSRTDHDHDVELSRLAPGDYFGEGGVFTGAAEKGKVRALTAIVIYEVSQAGLAQLMHERPAIADEISVTLCRRAKLGPAPVDEAADDMGSVPRLVARIRHLFEVPHG